MKNRLHLIGADLTDDRWWYEVVGDAERELAVYLAWRAFLRWL